MDSEADIQLLVFAVGALLTLVIWGAVGWWTITERPEPEVPLARPIPRDEFSDSDNRADHR